MIPFYADFSKLESLNTTFFVFLMDYLEINLLQDPKHKQELGRIFIQVLENMGYKKTVETLIEESGQKLENENLSKFRSCIENGQWQQAIEILPQLQLEESSLNEAKFQIYEQQYLELIEAKNINQALLVLRGELTNLAKETQRLHMLAGLILCKNGQELKERMNWNGAGLESRKNLLSTIQKKCKPTEMLETNRLEKLLKQALSYQIITCKYFDELKPNFSLLENINSPPEKIPNKTINILRDHTDEIWLMHFSYNGNYLASISKGNVMIIWEIDQTTLNFKVKHKKENIHGKDVNSLSWSYDSKMLLTASSDPNIKIWSVDNGDCLKTLTGHKENITAAIWLPDNKHLVSGGIDNLIIMWKITGEKLHEMKTNRVTDLMISENGKILFGVCASGHRIMVIDINNKQEVHNIEEKDVIISACISKDSKFLLVNTSYKSPELHLWSLKNYQLVMRYEGHFQEQYMIQCTFGGRGDRLLACGGEDSKIHIWHRNISKPQLTLTGHTLTVNCIAWHPKNPYLFVSGSDDCTVRVWTTDEVKQQYRKQSIMEEEIEHQTPSNHEQEQPIEDLRSFQIQQIILNIQAQLFDEENSQEDLEDD